MASSFNIEHDEEDCQRDERRYPIFMIMTGGCSCSADIIKRYHALVGGYYSGSVEEETRPPTMLMTSMDKAAVTTC
jgi:hypothetical protein